MRTINHFLLHEIFTTNPNLIKYIPDEEFLITWQWTPSFFFVFLSFESQTKIVENINNLKNAWLFTYSVMPEISSFLYTLWWSHLVIFCQEIFFVFILINSLLFLTNRITSFNTICRLITTSFGVTKLFALHYIIHKPFPGLGT